MEKLEYIPGDFVKIEYGEAAGKIGFVTNAILKRKGSYGLFVFIGKEFQGSSKDDWISTYNDEVSPIPLTTEILEKNGWKKSKINDCAYFYYKDGLFLTYTSKDDKFWFDDFDYSSSICVELPYVHSLQHLLFGLGIENEMEV